MPTHPVVRRRGPYRFAARGLRRVGVEIVDADQLALRCRACSATWYACQKWGRFAIGWWRCPRGCNVVLAPTTPPALRSAEAPLPLHKPG